MDDITTITEKILRQDLKDSLDDIAACELALQHGIVSYNGGSKFVQARLDTNKLIIEMITAELFRREK